jgi:hypothetical protein
MEILGQPDGSKGISSSASIVLIRSIHDRVGPLSSSLRWRQLTPGGSLV